MKHIKSSILYPLFSILLLISCTKKESPEKPIHDYSLSLDKHSLAFFEEAKSDTVYVNSDTQWFIDKDHSANWYSISPSEGGFGDGKIIVSVGLYQGEANRISNISIRTEDGSISKPLTIKQNGQNNTALVGVWGLEKYYRWNTDYNGDTIQETYQEWDFNPYDTTSGFKMYYLRNNTGWQVSKITDETLYFEFDYVFYQEAGILEYTFDSYDPNNPENYFSDVLDFQDTILKFQDEYRSHFFEKAEMIKVANFVDSTERILPTRNMIKKAADSPIFSF